MKREKKRSRTKLVTKAKADNGDITYVMYILLHCEQYHKFPKSNLISIERMNELNGNVKANKFGTM